MVKLDPSQLAALLKQYKAAKQSSNEQRSFTQWVNDQNLEDSEGTDK